MGTSAITDSHRSPLASLVAASSSLSFLDSFVAPLSLINALLISVERMNKQEITMHLKNMEHLWRMEGIYYPSENKKR